MITEKEIDSLLSACTKLPQSKVIEEEAHVFKSPVLILMSTVLSLNRKWYSHALPARQRFERGGYLLLNPKTLTQFQAFVREVKRQNLDWLQLSQALWKTKEAQKARQLAQLVDYFIAWHKTYKPQVDELTALRNWATTTPKESFLGKIKGLGPRAHEQLLWYLEGSQAIKLDRHVVKFVHNVLVATISEDDAIAALRKTAEKMGISATTLDARIWDYMQSGGRI